MKKVLFAVALLTISFSIAAKEVIELPGKVEPVAQGDDFALLQGTETDQYGMQQCYGYICGRWGCYKYEKPCE